MKLVLSDLENVEVECCKSRVEEESNIDSDEVFRSVLYMSPYYERFVALS